MFNFKQIFVTFQTFVPTGGQRDSEVVFLLPLFGFSLRVKDHPVPVSEIEVSERESDLTIVTIVL